MHTSCHGQYDSSRKVDHMRTPISMAKWPVTKGWKDIYTIWQDMLIDWDRLSNYSTSKWQWRIMVKAKIQNKNILDLHFIFFILFGICLKKHSKTKIKGSQTINLAWFKSKKHLQWPTKDVPAIYICPNKSTCCCLGFKNNNGKSKEQSIKSIMWQEIGVRFGWESTKDIKINTMWYSTKTTTKCTKD